MGKNKMTKTAVVFLVTGALALGGAAAYTTAYLTDHEGTVNEFTVGKVEIDLEEPDWNPDEHDKIEPSEVIKKNPMITNKGINDAYVYLEVSIPMRNVIAASPDGSRLPGKNQELFSFNPKADWNLLKKEQTEGYMVYTFNYGKILKEGETTVSLFDTVTFLNIIEGQLDTAVLEIPVKAFAIQTENTGGDGTINQKAALAYNKYLNQNRGQDGKVTVETTVGGENS